MAEHRLAAAGPSPLARSHAETETSGTSRNCGRRRPEGLALASRHASPASPRSRSHLETAEDHRPAPRVRRSDRRCAGPGSRTRSRASISTTTTSAKLAPRGCASPVESFSTFSCDACALLAQARRVEDACRAARFQSTVSTAIASRVMPASGPGEQAILADESALTSVDLPAFGRPSTAMADRLASGRAPPGLGFRVGLLVRDLAHDGDLEHRPSSGSPLLRQRAFGLLGELRPRSARARHKARSMPSPMLRRKPDWLAKAQTRTPPPEPGLRRPALALVGREQHVPSPDLRSISARSRVHRHHTGTRVDQEERTHRPMAIARSVSAAHPAPEGCPRRSPPPARPCRSR